MSSNPALENPVSIYNTLTRKKETFQPIEPGKVRMYNCGPTVYDYFHVGNARNFVCADMIRRYLAYRGYTVQFVQNITDVDDKIIEKAKQEGVSAEEIAQKYTKVFFDSCEKLGVQEADHHPLATKYVGKMIGLIKRLEEKGFAYASEGDVYFRVTQFPDYGKLSGRKLEDMLSGARIEVSGKKEHPGDFVLWKAAKEGEPFWKSPWGNGRPGWHIECSTMCMDLLGNTIDIHMGGNDLTFPHHENEVAQCEAATGKPFVRYWLHNGFLNINGEKMSKSLGNFFTIDEVLDRFPPAVVRYFLLSGHYRAPLDFSDTGLEEAKTALTRLQEAAKSALALADGAEMEPSNQHILDLRDAFEAAMDDDFNTPRAMAVLFQIAGRINQLRAEALQGGGASALPEEKRQRAAGYAQLYATLGEGVLGLELQAAAADMEGLSEQLLSLLLTIRRDARKSKQYEMADQIRNGLSELGIELLDNPDGTTEWKRK